jgi:hypothetical protein
VARWGTPGSIGRIGAVRFNAWIWDFSSTHRTTPRSGGLRYTDPRHRGPSRRTADPWRASMSPGGELGARTPARSEKSRSGSARSCGHRSGRPVRRVCGADSSVLAITSSTFSSVIVLGRPAGAHPTTHPGAAQQTARANCEPSHGGYEGSRDLSVLEALGSGQHDPRALRQPLSARSSTSPCLQPGAIVHRQLDLNGKGVGITHTYRNRRRIRHSRHQRSGPAGARLTSGVL